MSVLVHDRKQRDGQRKKIRRREAMAAGGFQEGNKAAVSPSVGDSYNRHRAAAWTKKMYIKNNKIFTFTFPLTNHRAPISGRKFFFLPHCSFIAPSLLHFLYYTGIQRTNKKGPPPPSTTFSRKYYGWLTRQADEGASKKNNMLLGSAVPSHAARTAPRACACMLSKKIKCSKCSKKPQTNTKTNSPSLSKHIEIVFKA